MEINDLLGLVDYSIAGAILGFIGGVLRCLKPSSGVSTCHSWRKSSAHLLLSSAAGAMASLLTMTHTAWGPSFRAVLVVSAGFAGTMFLQAIVKFSVNLFGGDAKED